MTTAATPPPPRAPLTPLADGQPGPAPWLSPGQGRGGKGTVVIGDPGLGKSTVTLDMAARVTTGKGWPDGALVESGNVVMLSAEDGIADTIRPRMDALGADVTRAWALEMV